MANEYTNTYAKKPWCNLPHGSLKITGLLRVASQWEVHVISLSSNILMDTTDTTLTQMNHMTDPEG